MDKCNSLAINLFMSTHKFIIYKFNYLFLYTRPYLSAVLIVVNIIIEVSMDVNLVGDCQRLGRRCCLLHQDLPRRWRRGVPSKFYIQLQKYTVSQYRKPQSEMTKCDCRIKMAEHVACKRAKYISVISFIM